MEDSRLIERLRKQLAEEDLAPGSRERVIIDGRTLEEWYRGTYGEEIDPEDLGITSVDLAEYRTHLLRTLKPTTLRRKMASTRKMLSLLNPKLLVELRFPKVPPSTDPAPSGFSKKERLALLRAASKLSKRDKAIISLLMWTGARASSIANAKLSNVEIKSRSGSITYDVAKGGRVYSVPLNAEAREALAAWIEERSETDHDHLFTSERFPFAPIGRWTIHEVWHRRMRSHLPTKIAERIRGPHQARHGLARMLLEQSVPLPDIAAILSHASVATTAGIYCRPSEQDLRRHLDRAIGEDDEE